MTQTSLEAKPFTETQVSEVADLYSFGTLVQLGNNSHAENEFRELAVRLGVSTDRLEELHVAGMRYIVERRNDYRLKKV